MAGVVRSAKDLWSLVSGTSVLKSKELVGYELLENTERILSGILYFKKANNASLDHLKKIVDDSHFDFINKFSKLLDVDAMQCYELFSSYISYEYKGTKKSLKTLLCSERHVHAMLLEVWNYFYSERLYCLLIMKHILGHWQDNSDPYKDLYEGFLDNINKDNAVVNKIISQLEASLSIEVPNKDSNGPYMSEHLSQHWVTYILKEQCELLQLLLLYYKVVEPTISDVQKMFSIFQRHGFGMRQPFRQFINEENQHFIDLIGCLEGLVIIQSLELEWLHKCQESGMDNEHFLVKDEQALKLLDSAIHTLGTHKSHGPILLTWMLVGQWSNIHSVQQGSSKLGNVALQLGVFEYFAETLKSTTFSGKGVVPAVCNRVIYGLLSILLTQFEIQTLGSLQPLIDITTSVLKFPNIAEDFWIKGMNNGVGALLKHSIDMFPLEFCLLLNLSSSLAQAGKESCCKVLKCIKQLPVVTEYMESTSANDIVATQETAVLKLIKSKALYGDSSLIIPEGTLGVLITEAEKSQSVIQWQINVNGWQILLRELHTKHHEISLSLGYVTEECIQRIIAIGKLVHYVLETDIDTKVQLSHIINILFSILQRFASHPDPPLELLATCINIASTLCKQKEHSVWQNIVQLNFMPFMTGFPRDVIELASGVYMNMGLLGQLIASKECVLGRYPLCLSFLNMIVNVSENLSADEDNSFLGCVLYILREIFSCFHKWFYLDPQEKLQIGQSCLNLLHNLFSVGKRKEKTHAKAQDLCIFSLLHFEAGQTLLRIVCTGEEVIQQTILKQNSDFGNQVAILIRLSLSVLNRLLLLRHHTDAPRKSSLNESSPLEKVLFSTPGHSEQPQVVLTVAHYAFQHYNPRLATLAVQLLKRFAKEFPMSLLACFSSEAEAIRDHFLSRLSSPSEDIRLKVSILEFLTVCVAQQPGLIEMFINVKRKERIPGKEVEGTNSCLISVKKVLKEKIESQSEYPQSLHCVAVEFIHALWAGHQALAMEALKQDPELWTLLCQNLLSEDFEETNHKINAYIIRTLALEVFYSSSAGSSSLSESVKKVFKEIADKDLLTKWSKHVNGITPKDHLMPSSALDCSTMDDVQDAFALYTAWRDFLLVIASYEPLSLSSETKTAIMSHILLNLTDQILGDNSRLLVLLAEVYLMLSCHWKSELALRSEETHSALYKILDSVASNADTVPPRVQLAVVSIVIRYIRSLPRSKNKATLKFKEWVSPVCKLLKKASVLVDQPLKNEEIAGFLKLPIAIICLLNKLVEETNDWLPVLKVHVALPLLVSLLTKSLKLEVGIDLAHTILTLFVSVATTSKAAEALFNTGFMAEITLMLSGINLETLNSFETSSSVVSYKKKITKVNVYYAFLRLVHALLHTLGNYFLQDALNFVGVHLENLHATLNQVRLNPLSADLQDAVLTCTIVYQLSVHQENWRLGHPRSLNVLLNDICDCTHAATALLMKPSLLKHLVEHRKFPDKKITLSTMDTESSKLKRLSSADEDPAPSENVVQVQNKLLELLAVTLSTMKLYSPGLYETVSDHRMDHGQWQLLLSLSFQTPSVDQEGPVSFGTVLACVNMCLRWLAKNEKTPSPGKMYECPLHVERHLLMYVLETSLTLLVSQSSLALTHPELSPRDKQLIKRELASELSMIITMVNRYLRRGPLSPASHLSSQGQSRHQTSDLPFMKLIHSLVNKLLK